jgi:hypothetical protein
MYLHLGQDTVVRTGHIVGIFDLENSTTASATREYISRAQKNGEVVNVSMELPKSFVVCSDGRKTTVYISQISAQTLLKRANAGSSQLQEPGAFGK